MPGDVGADDVLETREVVVVVRTDVDDVAVLVLDVVVVAREEVVLVEVVDGVPGTHWK